MNIQVRPGDPGSATALSPVLLLENRPLVSMRGIAALFVVYYHLSFYFYGNAGILRDAKAVYLCVDLFFVLSGFVMARVYWTLEPRRWRDFYIKRLFRIYPLHIAVMLCLGVTVAVAELLGISLNSQQTDYKWKDFFPVLTLASTFTSGYDSGWNRPVWALAIELICYSIFPMTIYALRKLQRFRWLSSFAMLLAISFIDGACQIGENYGYVALLRGLAAFTTGAIVFANLRHTPMLGFWPNSLIQIMALAGFIYCIASGFQVGYVCCAVLVGSLYFNIGILARLAQNLIFVWLGRQSFSIYVLHFPMIVVIGKILSIMGLKEYGAFVDAPVIYGSVLLASIVTYRYVETPCRRLPVWLGWVKPSDTEKFINSQAG